MDITSTEFIASYPRESACPKDERPEFAFIGRSNVGKSSLINMLTGRKGLAKVSGTPGKTQLINFFLINHEWHLVDLPGYGYARLSKDKRRVLSNMINGYMSNRQQLVVAFVLIDSNIEPTKIDIEFVNSLGESGVPFVLVFTKSDRIGKVTLQKNIDLFMQELANTWEMLPEWFVTSSEYRTGREDILNFIDQCLKPTAAK
ncbi:MAG: YihA family ribosome biogenesis GTP-binding protein [Saprospiraceae bacterium]|nr:YihA family ribosome biogenesis GTP-binding protein [Saprospiraceae bacterium]